MTKVNQLFDLKQSLTPAALSFLKNSVWTDSFSLEEVDNLSDSDYVVIDECLSIILDMSPEEADVLMSEIDHW